MTPLFRFEGGAAGSRGDGDDLMQNGNHNTAVLVAEPDGETGRKLAECLEQAGYATCLCATGSQALEEAEKTFFDLAFLSWDLQENGSLIEQLNELFPDTPLLVTSCRAELELAVRAMRLGAFNFLAAPVPPEAALAAVGEALEQRRLRREQGERRRRLIQRYDVENIVGQSRPMQEVFRLIHKVAATDATVLILGESGTGKELVARAIHYHSPRRQGPLVPVNCGAIPEELLESELFGHEKGAFTGAIRSRAGRFELAEGGTVFLDEIGDMSPMLQVKLLRVLQEHQFERIGSTRTIKADIRVIAATHQDLKKQVEQGHFREDLYYRLNVVPIKVPPLRERRSDIPLLCEHFLTRLAAQKGLARKTLHPEVKDRLMRYDWPGNVRELENLLERMVILAEGDQILPEDLPPRLAGELPPLPAEDPPPEPAAQPELPEEGLDFNQAVDAFERRLIIQALERTGWVKNRAANLLRLNRTTLVEKIKKKGITPPEQG